MKMLSLLRHAKSSWDEPSLADHDRRLNSRGLRDAPRVGRQLTQSGATPDCVLCSTAKRARETLQLALAQFDSPPPVRFEPRLYHASSRELVACAAETADSAAHLLVVGHNPGLEDWASQLAGEFVRFPTAALGRFTLDLEHWGNLLPSTIAKHYDIWKPKDTAS